MDTFWINLLSNVITTLLGAIVGWKLNNHYKKKSNQNIKNNICISFGNELIELHTHFCLAVNNIPLYEQGTFNIIFLKTYQEKLIPYVNKNITLKIQEIYNKAKLLQGKNLINYLDETNLLIDMIESLYNDIKIEGMYDIENSHIEKLREHIKYDLL